MGTATQDREYLKKLTILYVEDDEDTRNLLTIFLQRVAGKLVLSRDGEEGLAAFHSCHPQIIITDIQMPNMDGLTMAGKIRTVDSSVPIVVLTAHEQVDYLKKAINIGAIQYVAKPVDDLKLEETLLTCAHRVMAEEALKYAASTDPLTGLANRRELVARFAAEKSISERHGTVFSVIMVDIDHFKDINDTYGHDAGDHILKSVAGTMKSSIRTEDICGRWGGEEFLLMLPRIGDMDAVTVVAEKLRVAVSSLSMEWSGKKIAVTISLGVGLFKPGQDMETCIHFVDKALYRAKEGGRNRYAIAEYSNSK